MNIWIERCLFRCRIGQIASGLEMNLIKSLQKKAWHLDHKGVTLFLVEVGVRSSPIWPKLHRNQHLSIQIFQSLPKKAWHLVVLTKTGCFYLIFPVHEFLRIWNPLVGMGGGVAVGNPWSRWYQKTARIAQNASFARQPRKTKMLLLLSRNVVSILQKQF